MSQPTNEALLQQARRNQAFTNTSMSMGQCPLTAKEVAIFAVRYALDESPQTKATSQGPHPLPTDWPGSALPPLKTRSYTLRQLRDGWLYVWDSVDQTFHEYQVQGEMFIRHTWTDSQLNQDTRNNPGEMQPYLLYPRHSQLRIAYSPVQWTWRLCERMRSSATEQTQWMRQVDLPAFCTRGKINHGGLITELGKSVADILVTGQQAPAFTSTLLPTIATEPDTPFKQAFEEALVRGRMPEQDTALFIALDDPLAMVDDLSMNLTGRLLEQSQFETLHQYTLQSAFAVQRLCGFDADAFIPSSIKDPVQRQAYLDDLYTLLDAYDEVERGRDLVPGDQAGMVDIAGPSIITAAQTRFKTQWGHLPEHTPWQTALEEWNAKRLWREDVRFDDVRHYLSTTTVQAQQLLGHCQRSEQDLIAWLDRLSPSAEAIYHDTCNEDQASQLLETAHALYTLLGNGENGQRWLCQQGKQPRTLFGLALFNFNPEIASLIKQVTHNFSTTGNLDDQGREGDGRLPTLTPTSASDATNLGTRANEIKAVLDLETVQNSQLYKAMSSTAKQAMATLIKVANHQAQDAWHGLGGMLLPAMKQAAALTLAAPQVLISNEISSATQLAFNPSYQREYQAWRLELITVQKKMEGAKSILRFPHPHYDQRAARLSVQAQEARLKDLFLRRPIQIIARATGRTRLDASLSQINSWLYDLGQTEVIAHLNLAGTTDYLTRTQAWMNQNLGNALPALLVGLNAWNVYSTAQQAQNDGQYTADELRTLGANSAYAANAMAALWVGPAWSRAGGMATELGRKTVKVAQAGYLEWLREAKAASAGSAKAAVATEFATVSKGLILRTVTWASLGVVATALEAWQLSKEADSATSDEEETLLWTKFGVVFLMSTVATGQLIGAGLGYWFGFSWVMSTPVTIILAFLGIAYLMITMAANRYKREGLRLWLYRCSWGRGADPQWLGGEGHPKQMQALLRTLQRPSVVGRSVSLHYVGGRTPRKWLGFWVQIQVPSALAGKEVTLQPALIAKNYLSRDELQTSSDWFYNQFLYGNWVDPQLLGQLPTTPGSKNSAADFNYTGAEQHRLWQVWIETSTSSPILELEVKYPRGVIQLGGGRGYIFRLALGLDAHDADHANNNFSGELKEDDGIVLTHVGTTKLKLAVPQ